MPSEWDALSVSVEDDETISTQPSDDGTLSEEDTEEEETSEDTEETTDVDTDDDAEDVEDEPDLEPEAKPDAYKAEIESLKTQAAQSNQLNQQLFQFAQQMKREFDELKSAQAPKPVAKPQLPQGFDEEKFNVLAQANNQWLQNELGMSPREFKDAFKQLSDSQQQVIGQTNEERKNAYLQERIRSVAQEIGEDQIGTLSQAANSIYQDKDGRAIAQMDPTKPWNIPPDLAMKVALADKFLSEKRQSATNQSKARKAKVAKRDAADLASTKRTDKGGEAVLPEGFDEMSWDEAMDALMG